MQEQAHRLIHDTTKQLILPKSTDIEQPLIASNLQYENNEVQINGITLRQHPYFKFLFVRKFGKKYTVFNARTWKWSTTIPISIVFAFIESKDEWKVIDFEHVYNVEKNELNGTFYKGDAIENYKQQRFFHPKYTHTFVDFIGRQFIQTDDKVAPILDKSYKNVRFYDDGAWITMPAARFTYECFTGKRTDEAIALLDSSSSLARYRRENLCLKEERPIPSSFIPHILYSEYGIVDGKPYSTLTLKELEGELLSLYHKGKRHVYQRSRFIYECQNKQLLQPEEFIIDGKLLNSSTISFRIGDKLYQRTSDPLIYDGGETAFYTPWNKECKVIKGFINIGNRYKPNLIAVPITVTRARSPYRK